MSCSERQVQEAKLNINTANGKAQHIQWKVQVEKQHNGTGVGGTKLSFAPSQE